MSMGIITIQNVRGYIDAQGTAWLNVEDVARGLGFTQTAASGNEIVRWERVNGYLHDFGFVPTSGDGVKAGDYIPENMFYRLAMKAKNETAEKFQAIVADEILPTLRKTGRYEINRVPDTPIADIVTDIRKTADEIQMTFAGVQRGIALAKAVDIAEEIYDMPLHKLREFLPPAEHDTGFLNPTQIGERLGGLPPQAVNKLLASKGLQYKADKNWRLTDCGKNYGEEIPFTRNGHSGYRILWNESVIDFFFKLEALSYERSRTAFTVKRTQMVKLPTRTET